MVYKKQTNEDKESIEEAIRLANKKPSKEAISLVLSYHNNKRDMQDAINAYNAEKKISKNEKQALMKMQEALNLDVKKAQR
jgi:CHASE3 domain sensor protein